MSARNIRSAPGPSTEPPAPETFDICTSIEFARVGTRGRLVFAGIFAVLSLFIAPWPVLAAWLATIVAWEFAIRPWLDRVVLRLPGERTTNAYAAVNFVGSILYAFMPLLGFAQGSAIGVAIGAVWAMGSLISIFIYFSSSRRMLWACLAPPLAAALVGPFLAFGFNVDASVVGLLMVVGIASVRGYALDHRALARTLADRQVAVAELEGKLAIAIEASGDGMFELDLIADDLRVSPAWARMLGYEPEELAGTVRDWPRFMHLGDRPMVQAAYAAHFRGETPHTALEYRVVCKTGELKWVLARGQLVERAADGRPKRVVGTIMDVSARKALEQQLEAARDAAQAANQAKGEFLANMSHEIRTPLNGVIGTAGALARRPLAPVELEMVGLIQSSGQTLQRLISDILDQAKIESGQFELLVAPFDLHAEIETAAELMRARADEKGVAFRVVYGATARGLFAGDAVRLRQIVSNLTSNAIKFTKSGEVRIGVDVREPEQADGVAMLQLAVTDTGIGFDSEAARRLFARFTQADGSISRQYGGTGLGLAICKALVDLMGGEIGAESMPGAGSTFTARIPLPRAMWLSDYDARPLGAQPAQETADLSAEVGRLRILLVEDHPTNQRVAQLILEPAGVDLTIVGNGREAIEVFRPNLFDVILMDMQMPVMDGLAATREIRRLEKESGSPRTPLAMLTANAMREHLVQAAEAGADHLIAKPITPESLVDGINTTLAKAAAPPSGAAADGLRG